MRPLHLTLDGFTSFRAPVELDFSSLDLFAITGPTGAGKSSLIDALTFALYGQVPRVGREYKQLMSHGAERLSVRLDFRMGEETYRIARTLKSSGSPQSRLERVSKTGTHPVADRVKDIEDAVGRILGLDYDGFTRSVVLPQGQFDAFLKGKPEERRKILVTLLGLDVYERMHGIVNRKASDARAQAQFLLQQLALPDYRDATAEGLAAHRQDLATAEEAAVRAESDDSALDRALRTAGTLRAARAELHKLDRDHELETRRAAEAEAQRVKAVAASVRLDERRAVLEKSAQAAAVDPRREAVLAEAGSWAEDLARIAREGAALAGEREALASDALRRQRERDAADAALAAAEAATAAALVEKEAAQRSLEERKRTLAAHDLRTHLLPGEPCPVCERPVAKVPGRRKASGLEEAQALAVRAAAAAEGAREALESERLRRAKLDGDERAGEARLASLDARLEDVRSARRRRVESLEAAGFLPLDIAEPEALRRQIAHEARAVARAREDRERIESERRAMGDEVARVAAAVAAAEAQIAGASAHLADIENDRGPLASTIDEVRRALILEAKQHGWDVGDGRLRDEQSALETLRAGLRARAREARAAVERLRARTESLARAIERAAEIAANRQALETQSSLASALAQHLRADQFLAFVQEEALLRLADDGARHLRALSQGRYSLHCDDQEFGVTDHWHADRKRSVRTLSGGETFLASLALALALAESLASMSAEGRAGDALESLFLDEGFGTLDPETLDVVVQAIEALHGGQRLVGVVTHISELAERLPARVEVGRSAAGATLTLR
ncbi:MAG: SMC family ATPase [Vicinamibacteria bacterium]